MHDDDELPGSRLYIIEELLERRPIGNLFAPGAALVVFIKMGSGKPRILQASLIARFWASML
jgi:hypothetical protein